MTIDVLVRALLEEVVRSVLHEAIAILEFVYWLLELEMEMEYTWEDKWTFSVK